MMLSARLWQLCGAGWKARLRIMLLYLYLQVTASDHFFSVTLYAAASPSPIGSAGGKETNRTQQVGESNGHRYSTKCLPGRSQDCAPGAPHGLREPHHPSGLLGATRKRYACESSLDAASARVGSILFVFASFLVGQCIQRRVPFSLRGGAHTELRHQSALFFDQVRTREAALVFASLRGAVRHFQKVTETQQICADRAPGGSSRVSRRASFGGSWDVYSRQGVSSCIAGRLHRSASTDKLDVEAVSASPRKVGRNKKRDCTTTQSVTATQQTAIRLALLRGTQRFPMQGLPDTQYDSFETPEELKDRPNVTCRTFDLNKLKSALSSKLQHPKFPPLVRNVMEPTGWAGHGDGNQEAWCGVVAAVSKAISDACTRTELYYTAGDVREKVLTGDDASELYTSGKFLLIPAAAGDTRAVSSMSGSPTSSTPPDDTDSEERTISRYDRELAASETESEADGVEKSTVSARKRGKKLFPHPELSGQKKAASVPTLSSPKAQRHAPKKSASFPQQAKGAGALSPGSVEHRPSTYGLASTSSAEAEQLEKQGSPSHISLPRRWFALSKIKRSPTSQKTDRESEKSAELRPAEGYRERWKEEVVSELRRKNSNLLQEAEQLRSASLRATVEQAAGRIFLYVRKLDGSTAARLVEEVKGMSDRIVTLRLEDTTQLLYSAARYLDSSWTAACELVHAWLSLDAKTVFRSAFVEVCDDEAKALHREGFSASILARAASLQAGFARLGDEVMRGKSLTPEELETLLEHAKGLNALLVIIAALDLKGDAAITVGTAYAQLLQLAERLGPTEAAHSVVAYSQSIGAFVDSDAVLIKVEEETAALQNEVLTTLLEHYRCSVMDRLLQPLEKHKGGTSSQSSSSDLSEQQPLEQHKGASSSRRSSSASSEQQPLEQHRGASSSGRSSTELSKQRKRAAAGALVDSAMKDFSFFFQQQLKASVNNSVKSDMQRALRLLPQVSLVRVSHLFAILNSPHVREQLIAYHTRAATEVASAAFREDLPRFVSQLRAEYFWLRDWVAIGTPGRFEVELEKTSAKLNTLIMLTEELGLSNSAYATGLRRAVRISRTLDIEACDEGLNYIASWLTISEEEDADRTLPGITPTDGTASERCSVEEVVTALLSAYPPAYEHSSV